MTDPYAAPGPQIPDDILAETPQLVRALDAVAKASQVKVVFSFLEDYLIGRQHQLDRELFKALADGAQSDAILAICHQKNEAHRFMRNLEALLKTGQAAGRILQPMMDQQI